MKPIAPNTLIQNRYLIVHLIGKGGMGEVYLAVDQRLGSAIALKRTFFSDDATLGNAFEREAKTLARLRHPVLPKVSDHFTEEGTQYLVMDHISGDDISKRLENMPKPFPLSWVLFWADQLLDALNYLHAHEPPIIHRDIKPQNLKLTDENHIVLLDFGLSKNSVGETRTTTAGSIVGYTPHYAPMEQIRGTGTDARSDIYSLCATLYQILTGEVPPDALTRADSLINGLPDPIVPISDLNKEVPKTVSDVIIKGMTISQEQRYKTAREMQKALRDAYTQMQTGALPQTPAPESASQPEMPQSQQKTAVLSGIDLTNQTPATPPIAPIVSNPAIPQANEHIHHSQSPNQTKNEPDFDATMRYDEATDNTSSKQSNIKTEVFLAGSSSAITSAQAGNFEREDNFPPTNDFDKSNTSSNEENFAPEDDFSQPENYSPGTTVPLISFDSKSGNAAAIDSIAENREGEFSSAAAAGNHASSEAVYSSNAAPTKQKSNKALAVVGGLAALLFLLIGAGGLGWYMLRDKGTVEKTTPTPTPEATVSAAPTTAPTTEPTLEAITNTSTNSEDNSSNTSIPANTREIGTTTTPSRLPQSDAPTPIKPSTPKPVPPGGATRTPTARTPKPGPTIVIAQ